MPDAEDETPTDIWFNIFFTVILLVLYIGIGASISPRIVRERLTYPRGPIIVALHQFIINPLFAWWLTSAFGLTSPLKVAIRTQTMCPAGALSTIFIILGMVDISLGITCTAVSICISIVVMPIWSFVFLHNEESVVTTGGHSAIEAISLHLLLIVVGTCLGVYFSQNNSNFLERGLKLMLPLVVFILLMVLFEVLLNDGLSGIDSSDLGNGLAVAFIIPLIAMVSSFIFSVIVRLPKSQSLTVAIESSMQNSVLAFAVLYELLDYKSHKPALVLAMMYMLFTIFLTTIALILGYHLGWTFADRTKPFYQNWKVARDALSEGNVWAYGTFPSTAPERSSSGLTDINTVDFNRLTNLQSNSSSVCVSRTPVIV